MQNRFIHLPRVFAVISVLILSVTTGKAQAGFFNFTPPPTEIGVGSNCFGAVSYGVPPVVTPITPGAIITVSQFSSNNMYAFTDQFPLGTPLLVKWAVSDDMGHSAEFEFGVTFVDLTPPVFNTMVTLSPVTYHSIAEVPPLGPIAISDNCSDSIHIVQTFSQTLPPSLCQAGTFQRTWTATDAGGNFAIYTQTIQIYRDSLPPVITVPPTNGSAPCTGLPTAYTNWLAAQMALFTATDHSGTPTYSNNAPPALASCPGPVTVTFQALDLCGIPTTATATFSSSDTQVPTVVTEPKDTVAYCNNHAAALGQFLNTHGYAQVTDACSPTLTWRMLVNGIERDSAQIVAILQDSLAQSVCGVKLIGSQTFSKVRGYVRVDFFAKDICLNEVFVGQGVFGVLDTTPPVITGPAVTTETCGGTNDQTALTLWINAHGNASVTDICSPTAWYNFSYTTSDGQSGTGNFVTGPFPTVQPNNCTWFTDVTFRASDECGNIGSKTLRFTLNDNIPPVIGGFADTTVLYCPTPIPATFTSTVTDNCSTGLNASYTTQFADTVCVGNYTLKVLWTATDQCNNTATRTQIYLIRDTLAPQFVLLPAPVTVSCDSVGTVPAPVVGTTVTANDICGQLQGISYTSTSNQHPDILNCGHYNYQITRVFVAIDQCGNTRTASQVITVRDIKGPVSAIPLPDTVVFCQNLPLNAAIPPAVDQCSPVVGAVVQQSQTIIAGTCPDSYTIAVTWRALDVCGNIGLFTRNYLVRDTIRPAISNIPLNVTVECDAIPVAPSIGSLVTSDNCDSAPMVVFSETEIREPDVNNCNHWGNYQIKRQWTVTDACANARTYTQTISVMDNTPPVFVVKDTIIMPNSPGLCGANILPPGPLSAYDQCAVLAQSATLRDTTAITGPPSSEAVCDTVFLAMNSSHLPPLQPVTGTSILQIFLDNVDAEDPNEFFRVYGENDVYIGQTTQVTPTQCGSGVTSFNITAQRLNDWLTDGQLTLTLVPNGTGALAINPICVGRRVRAEIAYTFLDPQVGVQISYSVDNGPQQSYPASSPMFLSTGTHTIVYTVSDCVGNSTTASTLIRIDDIEPPLLSVPAAQTAYVGVTNCNTTWTVPLPGITENCSLSGVLSKASVISGTKFVNNPNAGNVPQDITLDIVGVIPNAFANGILKIRHRGDNGSAGEFFRVLDEQNNTISTTTTSSPLVSCVGFHETIITVSAAQINAWAADGVAKIKLVANTDAFNFADFINPCGTLNAGGFDGTSAVQAVLEYNYAIVDFEIKNPAQVVVQSGQITGQQTAVQLAAGVYTVHYSTSDLAGNLAQSSYVLTVRDTVKPQANCQNIAIFVSVSGAAPYTLSPAQIDEGSIDNCGNSLLTLSSSQTVFTCNQSGQIVPVTLTVTDTSGNMDQCSALISVNTEMITASSTANICEGGAAQLFCDPPGNDANYTYKWANISGVFSMVQNPTINNVQLSQEGTYFVTVTGPTGCTAVGETQLQLIGLPYQPIIVASQNLVCEGQSLTLTTAAYSGSDVSYQWYRNSIDTLVATTIQPNLVIGTPPTGTHQYFVRIIDLNCGSALSAPTLVNVQVPVAATLVNNMLNPCEGDLISLGTTIQGTGVTYKWTGPEAFDRTDQYPLPFAATLTNGGTYTLVVSVNGCPGASATAAVTVRDRPEAPVITGNSGVCEGATVMLSAQPAAGNPFLWISPALDTVSTGMLNALTLNNVTQADSGYWKVISVLNGCASPAAAPHLVAIEKYPVVVANANTPLCQGSVLNLSADVNQVVQTYNWSGPPLDGFSAFNNASVSDNTPSSGFYSVTVSTTFGCSANAVVEVNVVNPPLITSVTSDAAVCVDGNTPVQLFHTLASMANGPYTYAWTYPNGTISSEPFPTIPSADITDNGSYSLVVTDQYGCFSAPQSTILSLQMIPATPVLVQADAVCEGEIVNVSIENGTAYPPGSLFTWQTPANPGITTTAPVYPIFSASLGDEGIYFVQVQTGDCISQISAPMLFDVKKLPAAPAVEVNSPVCQGDTIAFEAIAPVGVTVQQWNWSGPSGFAVSAGNTGTPFRFPALPEHAGAYFVNIVTTEGCQSAQGEPVPVVVKPQPQTPIALLNGNICLDQPDTLILQVAPGTQTDLAYYTWYNNTTQLPVGLPGLSPVFPITDFTGYSSGQNAFYVVAELDGCASVKSFPVSAYFDLIPNVIAQVQTDSLGHCGEIPLDLLAIPPSTGTGLWSLMSGPPVTIINPSSVFALVNDLQEETTYQFLWTLSKGACKNFSQDTMTVTVNSYEQASAMPDTTVCFASEVQLYADPGLIYNGYWTQPIGQASITNPKIEIVTPDSTHTMVTGLRPISSTQQGFIFVWTIDNLACGLSTDTVEIIPIYNVPIAQADSVQCAVNDLSELHATPLEPFETGLWRSPNAAIEFNNPGSPVTMVSKLSQGDNMFIWETNGGVCGNRSRDTAIITLELRPTAFPDTVNVPFGSPVAINLGGNDIIPSNYIINILTPPNTGVLNSTGTTGAGTYNYIPEVTFTGTENVLYSLCNVACLTLVPDDACSVSSLTMFVGESSDCDVPSLITPNDDNINDKFFVPCLGCSDCPNDNELTIFNQWGDHVFYAKPYLQDWEGTYKGKPLPEGSYYYVLKYATGTNTETKTGFILIQR